MNAYEQKRRKKCGEEKKKMSWTTWAIIGMVAVFVLIVACMFFVKRYNGLSRTYVQIGDQNIKQVEYNYYYSTIVNNFYAQNSNYLMYLGIDQQKPLDDQTCLYDSRMTWKDYFDQSTVPMIQAVKALNQDAVQNGFEYDVTEDYNTYINNINTQIESNNISKSLFYEKSFGEFATEERLEPYVKEYLTYQAYYKKLKEDQQVDEAQVKAEYEAHPENYDTIDYHLYSMVADVEDDATEEELKTAMDQAEKQANEMVDRFKAGEDWRELCYEYASDEAKDNFDPTSEADPTAITGANKTLISNNYNDWLYDESRKANDVMVYRDESNKACFVVAFDAKTTYDLEADSADIKGNLTTEKVADYIDGLIANYPVTDAHGNLKYLTIEETEETSSVEDSDAEKETEETSRQETTETQDTAVTEETNATK